MNEGFQMNIVEFLDEKFDKEDVQDIATFFGLSTTGKKAEIIRRIVTSDDFEVGKLFDHFSKETLHLLCFDAKLPASGSKKDLWNRIISRFKLDMEIPLVEETTSKEALSTPSLDENTLEEKQIFEEQETDDELREIEDIIKNWSPDKRHNSEEGYQVELSSLLKHKYGLKVRYEAGATHIDILVNDNIPIELKKNPNRGDFDRLDGQIMRNIDEYGKLIVVICRLETKELFLEYKNRNMNRFSPEELIFIIK